MKHVSDHLASSLAAPFMFYELVIADFKDLTCLEQNYIGKRPKDFEANGFYCYIIDNTYIFWNQSQK